MKLLSSLLLFLAMLPGFAGELQRPVRANLYDDYANLIASGAGREQIFSINEEALKEIYQYSFESRPSRVPYITWDQARFMLDLVEKNPVASQSMLWKYDHDNLGFCFGRALFIHLELLRRGVQKEAIKKAFAVGPMRSGVTNWQFHVTTIVLGPKNEWIAIDPFVGEPVRVEQWFDIISKTSTDGKLRFYLSEPSKIGPSGWEYNTKPGGLLHPVYNHYFEDMFDYFRKNPLPREEKFNR